MPVDITVFGASRCSDTVRSRKLLQERGIEFLEIDIEAIPQATAQMRMLNGDSGKVPTILMESAAGREVLVEPTDEALSAALDRHSAF